MKYKEGLDYFISANPSTTCMLFLFWRFQKKDKEAIISSMQQKYDCHVIYLEEDVEFDPEILKMFRKDSGSIATNPDRWHIITSGQGMQSCVDFLCNLNRSFASLSIVTEQIGYNRNFELFKEIPVAVISGNKAVAEKTSLMLKKIGFDSVENFKKDVFLDNAWFSFIEKAKKPDQIHIDYIGNHLWMFSMGAIDSFYLIETPNKAIVIDTGSKSNKKILPIIRSVTDKDISLIITHGHGDHIGNILEFNDIYYPENDIELLCNMIGKEKTEELVSNGILKTIQNSGKLNIGGLELEIADLGGHTKGSIAIVDKTNKRIFSGDAVGSGFVVLMTFKYSMNISDLQNNIEAFIKKYHEGLDDVIFWGGHTVQETEWENIDRSYHPLTWDVLYDMKKLCSILLTNPQSLEYVPFPSCNQKEGEAFQVTYKSASIVLLKSKIK